MSYYYFYNDISINALIASTTGTYANKSNSISKNFTNLPGDTNKKVNDLYLITKIGYNDTSLTGPSNLAEYYMPYTVELSSSLTSYQCPTIFKKYRALIIGGGGGGGGSGGVSFSLLNPQQANKETGGDGGGGGAGGTYLLLTSQTITTYTFTYSIGTGGEYGKGARKRRPEPYDNSKAGKDGNSSKLFDYTASYGYGGKEGKSGFGISGINPYAPHPGVDGIAGGGGSGTPAPVYNGASGSGTSGGDIKSYDDTITGSSYGGGGSGNSGGLGFTSDNNNAANDGANGTDGNAGKPGYIAIFLFIE